MYQGIRREMIFLIKKKKKLGQNIEQIFSIRVYENIEFEISFSAYEFGWLSTTRE